MGISVDVMPMIGLGFAMHLSTPLLEFVIGPFVIMIGDLDAYSHEDDA